MTTFSVHIVGKNVDLGTTFKNNCKERILKIFKKYSTNTISYKTTLEKNNNNFKVSLKVNLVNKIQFETIGRAKNANRALDIAVYLISKRIRRYLRKIKKRKIGRINNTKSAILLNTE